MHSRSAVVSRSVFVAVASAWSVVAVAIGLLSLLEWPRKFAIEGRWLPIIGLGLLVVGQFMSALVADQLFPAAHRRLTAIFELGPWLLLAAFVIGGLA
ncbi:MAG: hypothetical protein ACK4WH_09000 [Phycisphaerales bacterium]